MNNMTEKMTLGVATTVLSGILIYWFTTGIISTGSSDKVEITIKNTLPIAENEKKELTYENSTQGLRKLFNNIVEGIENDDPELYPSLIDGFYYKNYDRWLWKTFGREYGSAVSKDFKEAFRGKSFYNIMYETISSIVNRGNTKVKVRKFTGPSKEAVGIQNNLMEKMINPVPIYSVRLVKPGKKLGNHMYNFVFVDGHFRFMGKMIPRL